MIRGRIFVSFASEDEALIIAFVQLLRTVLGNEVIVWYSSDQGRGRGIAPGNDWYEILMQNLMDSDVLIPFLTPNSVKSPWVLYEVACGDILERQGKCSVRPVWYGNSELEIPDPLMMSRKQASDITHLEQLHGFIDNLLDQYRLDYPTRLRNVVSNDWAQMKRIANKLDQQSDNICEGGASEVERIEKKIDIIMELMGYNPERGSIEEKEEDILAPIFTGTGDSYK